MKIHNLFTVPTFTVFKLLVLLSLFIASPAIASDAEIEKGKAVYNGAGACFSCHGALGKGDGVAAASLNPKPASFATGVFKYDTDKDGKTGTEADLLNIITKGAAAYGGSPLMVGRPDLSEADRKALVSYVLSLKE